MPSEHTLAALARPSARGDVHRWSATLIPTAREAPADAETPSHVLLARAGFIRKVAAGVYDYLPLAWRSLTKIAEIIRQEMNAAGAAELLMPAFVPLEFYQQTRRHEAYGELLFRLHDRKKNTLALGPTHEETITELVKGSINSYKQLPLNLYQIQTKFRDEARPRAGLLRCREFIMKDAYSFHTAVEGPGGLNDAYDAMYRAYNNIFKRCGLDYTAVEAESGPIGGSASHEFMVNCESGEDTILRCPASGYAANVEKCEIGPRQWGWDRPTRPLPSQPATLQRHHTPGMPGIEQVAGALRTTPSGMLKTIVFQAIEPAPGDAGKAAKPGVKWILVTVRGDHDVNEGKVKAASGYAVALADEKAARAAGFAIGYVSPAMVTRVPGTILLVDPDAATADAWATGADENDYHMTGFTWQAALGQTLSDPGYVKVADLRNALQGDPSPRAPGSTLQTARGIEVGHIFKLGTKYSDAMGLKVLDDKQQSRSVIMGCYGIGVSRTLAACVEMSHDADGIIWPAAIAPYHVVITLIKPAEKTHADAASSLARALSAQGLDVLIDDRDERPGVKFKDADLIGIPVRITIGEKALADNAVEFKPREAQGKGELVKIDQAPAACLKALGLSPE